MKKVKFNTFTDDFTCDCGNQRNIDGFHPCDKKGNIMEPDKDSIWDHDYWCGRCGVVIHVLINKETR